MNNVDSDIFVDTGARHTIIDLDFWTKVNLGQDIGSTRICLLGVRGKSLFVVGNCRIRLGIGNVKVHFPVVVVEQFKFEQHVVIDYGSKDLRIGCMEVCFENLPS